jgi:hypothetical protein
MSYVQRRRFLWILFLAGIAVVAAVAASGTTLVPMRFEELAEKATAVVRLRCVSTGSLVEQGEIWTETRFQTVSTEKGAVEDTVTVRMPGGRLNGLHSRVDGAPEFVQGEEVYLFLWRGRDGTLRVLGWTQGTFRIRRDAKSGRESVTQDSASAVFEPETRKFREDGVRDMPVSEFRRKLRTTLEEVRKWDE